MLTLTPSLKWRTAKFLPILLAIQLLLGLPTQSAPTAQAATVANCTTSQFTITAKHNSVFYFDQGTTITSGYAEYQIVNKGSSGTYWAKLENFTGSALALARYEVATRPLGTLATNASTNQYWYLTASAVSSSTQGHDVVIYSSDPSAGGGTAVCKLTRGFTSTASTIAASANKLTSVEYSALGTAGVDTFTATVKGQTGTIGQGPTKNSDVNLNPATHADFAAENYRLKDVSYQCTGGTAITGSLYIPNACEGNYTAVFTFAYLSVAPTDRVRAVSPIMQIASGTQMKHTSTPSFTIAVAGTTTVPAVTTVGATYVTDTATVLNGTIDLGTFTTTYFCYSTSAPAGGHFDLATCAPETATAGSPYNFFNLTGLTSKTTYYFEYIGQSTADGIKYGGVKQFRTLDPVPVATTETATAITSSSATLPGSVTVFNASDVSSAFFILSKTSPGSLVGTPARNRQLDQYANDTITATVATWPNFTLEATSLTSNTTYYYELVVVDSSTAQYFGGVRTFTTSVAVTYTVTFNPNGGDLDSGSPTDTATVTSGDNALLYKPNPNPERTGYNFVGWGTASDSTTALSSFTVTGAVTLYAVWSLIPPPAPTGGGYVPPPATITWPTPAQIKHPTPLGTTQLNATALCNGNPITGTYKYTPGLGEILLPGTYTLSVTFTPTSGGCQSSSTTVQIVVVAPTPPTITKISSPEVCAVGSQLTLTGTYLTGATATVDGVAAQVLSSNSNSMLISLPARAIGTKTIVVTNVDGTASTTVKYKFIDSPVYVNYIYPETFKDRDFSYTFTATNAEKYAIVGKMPAGLTLNTLTGEISGAPTEEGDFVFTIVASNFCDETHLIVYMFVDKAIPNTFTCSVAFNVPKSDNITDYKLTNLQKCLEKMKTLTPKYIEPIIYLSGGIPDGLSTFQALTHPRYIKVIDFIKSIGLDYQIYVGAFGGTTESIQVNVYWPST